MIIALPSASGAPGCTTLSLALLLAWPTPAVLVEADLSRPSAILAGYFAGGSETDWGVPGLARAAQAGTLTVATLTQQSQELAPARRVVPGIASLGQAEGASHYMGAIASMLGAVSDSGVTVLVDLGRLSPATPGPILAVADLIALVTGSRLPDLMAARDRAAQLAASYGSRGTGLGTLVTRPGQPFPAKKVASFLGLPLLGDIAEDATAAAHLSSGSSYRSYDRSRLAGSAAAAASRMISEVTASRARLGLGEGGDGADHA